jgi:hypothetical protein
MPVSRPATPPSPAWSPSSGRVASSAPATGSTVVTGPSGARSGMLVAAVVGGLLLVVIVLAIASLGLLP